MNETLVLVFSGIQTLVIALSFGGLIWQLRQTSKSLNDNISFKSLEFYVKLNDVREKYLHDRKNDIYDYLALGISFYEQLYLLHKAKRLDQEAWKAWEEWFGDEFLSRSEFRTFWKKQNQYYDERFVEYLDKK